MHEQGISYICIDAQTPDMSILSHDPTNTNLYIDSFRVYTFALLQNKVHCTGFVVLLMIIYTS